MLTDVQIRKAKKADKAYKLADSGAFTSMSARPAASFGGIAICLLTRPGCPLLAYNQRLSMISRWEMDRRRVISSSRNAFMERLKRVILEYEETIERPESGQEKVHRTGRFGEKEDISIQTADHYRRLLSHYMEIVARNEATKTKARR